MFYLHPHDRKKKNQPFPETTLKQLYHKYIYSTCTNEMFIIPPEKKKYRIKALNHILK